MGDTERSNEIDAIEIEVDISKITKTSRPEFIEIINSLSGSKKSLSIVSKLRQNNANRTFISVS